MRKIKIDFTSLNCFDSIFAGYTGEHNATELLLVVPEEMISKSDYQVVIIQSGLKIFKSDKVSNDTNKTCYRIGNTIHMKLDKKVTRDTSVSVQVEFCKNDDAGEVILVAKTPVASNIHLKPSPNGETQTDFDDEKILGNVFFVVERLPLNPKVGDIVFLNMESTIPWDTVKVWSPDEAPYKEEGMAAICADLLPVGTLKVGEIPEKLDLSAADKSQLFASGLALYGSGTAFQITVSNIYGDTHGVQVMFQTPERTYSYKEAGAGVETEGWYDVTNGNPVPLDVQDIQLPDVPDLRVLDLRCTMTAQEIAALEGMSISLDLALAVLRSMFSVIGSAGVYLAEENNGTTIWTLKLRDTWKEINTLTAQVAENKNKASSAYELAGNAASRASEALTDAGKALSSAGNAVTTANAAHNAATGATNAAMVASEKATNAHSLAEDNASSIEALQREVKSLAADVGSYSTFLDELNGEVV